MFSYTFLFLSLLALANSVSLSKLNRVVGGRDANICNYPYVVSLRRFNSHVCGGSLIAPNWVLTAAHCVDSRYTLRAVVGSSYLNSGGTAYGISQYIRHERYNPNTINNDVALVKLSSSVRTESCIKTINLNTNFIREGAIARYAGFGLTRTNGTSSNVLQELTLTTISNRLCAQTYGSIVNSGTLCTARNPPRTGICGGDSGGPLATNGTLIGVASYTAANGCALNYPDGFVRVSYYVDWIRNTIANNS